jgi:hypothetical protein
VDFALAVGDLVDVRHPVGVTKAGSLVGPRPSSTRPLPSSPAAEETSDTSAWWSRRVCIRAGSKGIRARLVGSARIIVSKTARKIWVWRSASSESDIRNSTLVLEKEKMREEAA